MSASVRKVLIIGGGFSGMSAAIELRKQNIETHLLEVNPDWQADGAGISIGGATLRAFKQLGILERFLEEGSAHDGVDIALASGQIVQTIPTERVAGPDIPGSGAIMRPVLAKILADKVIELGAKVRLGCTYTSIDQDSEGVTVSFTDKTSDRFDLVIAADGLYSKTREWLLPDAPKPEYTGQGVWRAVLEKPDEIKNTTMWMGPNLKVGVNPMSKEQVYLFLTEDKKERERIPEEQLIPVLKDLLSTFPAPSVQAFREQLDEASQVMFRPLEGLLVPQPWFKERVVLIGDTVHATIPHLASGACIGIEDAIVLVEELVAEDNVDVALNAFQQRRWERCRMVVENSSKLGKIEIEGGDKKEHAKIMAESMASLSESI